MAMLDLTKKIIIKDIKGEEYILNDVGKKVIFSFLWRNNYVDKIRDYSKIQLDKNKWDQ